MDNVIKDVSKLRIGMKVHYIPFEDCGPELFENGIIKEIPDHTMTEVRVVYHCNGEWDRYQNYTGALTRINQLRMGWYH